MLPLWKTVGRIVKKLKIGLPYDLATLFLAIYPEKNIIAIFEPHTYSRTKEFAQKISEELNKCNYSYVLDIYKSREKQSDYPNINSDIIIKNLKKGEHINKQEYKKLLKHHDSVLIFMSPNDLSELEENYKKTYKEKFDK